jgi:hypothetical protein
MIDLEHVLGAITDGAPEPPPVARLVARAQQRRRRRLGVGSSTVAVIVLISAIAVVATKRQPTSTVSTATISPTAVTSLYGTTLDINMPGYPLGAPRFDATVQAVGAPFPGPPSIVVTKTPPPARSHNASRYIAPDGHELYAIHTGAGGDQLVGSWNGWTVYVTVDGISDADRVRLASLLRVRDHHGFLVLDLLAPLHAVPSVGTEVAFDGVRIDGSTYPIGCPTPAQTSLRTSTGFAVQRTRTKAIWCDTTARVRIEVEPPAPVDTMIERLHITRTV